MRKENKVKGAERVVNADLKKGRMLGYSEGNDEKEKQ
jgi:hypothetical protein